MKRNAFIFSGLGADERVFQRLYLPSLNVIHVKWITPKRSEPLTTYAKRLAGQIDDFKPLLIGLSFGGIIAVEVAKLVSTTEVILISSAQTFYEIPVYYRFAGKLKLNRLIPANIMKRYNFISRWMFGLKSSFEKKLLKNILENTDPNFLTWAIDKIVNWKNSTRISGLKHIHGTTDKILPIRFVSPDYIIEGGGHFMVLNRAKEISDLINKIVSYQY